MDLKLVEQIFVFIILDKVVHNLSNSLLSVFGHIMKIIIILYILVRIFILVHLYVFQ